MDLQFNNYNEGSYSVGFGGTMNTVSGNKKLANRFQLTMFTNPIYYQTTSGVEIDSFGGGLGGLTSSPLNIKSIQSIAAILTMGIEETVRSIQATALDSEPNTEKIKSAELARVWTEGDVVYAIVDITPIEKDSTSPLSIEIPFTVRG